MSKSSSVPTSTPEVSFWFWVVSCSALLGLGSAVDLAFGGEGRNAAALFWSGSLGCAVGVLHGVFLGGAFGLLRRRRRLLRVAFWVLFAAGAVAWPLDELGVIGRLNGEYRNLALLSLVALVAAGAAAAGLLLLLQPTPSRPRGWIGSRGTSVRRVAAGGLLIAAIAMAVVDRNFYEGGYSIAHLFLEVAALWCFFLSVSLFWEGKACVSPRAGLSYVAVTFGLFAVTAFTLTPAHVGELNVMLERPYSALALETGRGLFDFDLDGHSSILGGGDCEAFLPHVNPGRGEIPGNGVDDNCRYGDAPAVAPSRTEVSWPDEPSPTSVVLITVDTLSAPYMSLYGGKDKTSPRIDAWAKDAAVFDRAYTSGGWTSLAISSMMRGLYPRHLQWTRLFETNTWRLLTVDQLRKLRKGEHVRQMFGLPLDDPRMTLPMWLSLRGMSTNAVVNDGKSEFLDPVFQKRGFDQFVDMDKRVKGRPASDQEVTVVAKKVLQRLKKTEPFFLWVHYFGPHLPNTEHPGVPRFGRDGVGRYEHEIAALDKGLGPLLERLDVLSKKHDIAVILTSDHGEVIHATGRGHGRVPAEGGIRVPLVIKAEGFTPGRYDSPVSLVDLFPTIAALTKSPMPERLDGVDLARVVSGDPSLASRALLSETWRYGKDGRRHSESVAALDGSRRLTLDVRTQARTLREQTFPEDEKQNLLNDPTQKFDALEDALYRHMEAGSSATFVR